MTLVIEPTCRPRDGQVIMFRRKHRAREDLRDPGAPGLAMGGRDAVDLRDQIVLEPKTDHHFQSPVQRCHRANVLHWCQMAYPAIPHN